MKGAARQLTPSPSSRHCAPRASLLYGVEFWGGMYFGWLMFGVVALVTPLMSDIVWSGVAYRKSKGLVSIRGRHQQQLH